jgi:hypothetical protein
LIGSRDSTSAKAPVAETAARSAAEIVVYFVMVSLPAVILLVSRLQLSEFAGMQGSLVKIQQKATKKV